MAPPIPRIAIVTGGNRGIGFEIARQLLAPAIKPAIKVVIGSRDDGKGRAAAARLSDQGADVAAVQLDVTDPESIASAVTAIEKQHGPIDILINNAAILIDGPGGFASSLFDMTDETLRRTFETNVLGPAHLIKAVVPGMRQRGFGRVVNVSSRAGQLSGMGSGFPAYRMSKTALNALTRIAAAEANHPNILINAMCPGWCRTDMGGAGADRSPEEGARTAVWLATSDKVKVTGGFFQDEKQIAW